MRFLIPITLISLLNFSCSQQNKQTLSSNLYGEAFEIEESNQVSDINIVMANQDSIVTTFTGSIDESCKAKGCWMTVNTGYGKYMRVTFKDYGFFVPTEGLNGKNAIFKGYCIKKETSVDEQRHYAQDAGKTSEQIALITTPKLEYQFVASGVIIED